MTGTINFNNQNFQVSSAFARKLNDLKADGLTEAELTQLQTPGEGATLSPDEERFLAAIRTQSTVNLTLDIDGAGTEHEPNTFSFDVISGTSQSSTNPSTTSASGTTAPSSTGQTTSSSAQFITSLSTRLSSGRTYTNPEQLRSALRALSELNPAPSYDEATQIGQLLNSLSARLEPGAVQSVISSFSSSNIPAVQTVLAEITPGSVPTTADANRQAIDTQKATTRAALQARFNQLSQGNPFTLQRFDQIVSAMERNGASAQEILTFLSDAYNFAQDGDAGRSKEHLRELMTDTAQLYDVTFNDSVYLSNVRNDPFASGRDVERAEGNDRREIDQASAQVSTDGQRVRVGGFSFGIGAGAGANGGGTITNGGVGSSTGSGTSTASTTAGGGVGISAGWTNQTGTATATTQRQLVALCLRYERLIQRGDQASIQAAQRLLGAINQYATTLGLNNVTPPTTPTINPTTPSVTVPYTQH